MSRDFRTIVNPTGFGNKISHRDGVVLLGSCFAENIGERLNAAGFNATINPLGIIFHPIPLAESISRMVEQHHFGPDDLVNTGNKYVTFGAPSKLSSEDVDETLERLNAAVDEGHKALSGCRLLIITFGTSWGYRHVASQEIVANCHRFPQVEFSKVLTRVDEMGEAWEKVLKAIKSLNPEINICLTVSPVRHAKDGLPENNLSKSLLRVLTNSLAEKMGATYFPSYEIMMDDLRDYRFYADDMLHPSQAAIDYIWEKFETSAMTPETVEINRKFEKMSRFFAHKSTDSEHLQRVLELRREWEDLSDYVRNRQ